jgi:Response regulators consisting of a CheY-like receiver domain and a winged-helix DNA-binding domain
MKVLVIEDEKELSDSICSYLANEQFVCEKTFDFDSSMEKILLYDYACIVL